MVYKIAVTGPESTGKTELVKQLAELYDTVYVPEYAREYLDKNGMNYIYEDVLNMAKGQIELEKQQALKANRILFSDTDMIAYKVWLTFHGWEVPAWLTDHIKTRRHDLYLLTDIDLPWVADGQRDNPDDRELLFNRFQEELDELGADYGIISGKGILRLDNAISTIEEYMKF